MTVSLFSKHRGRQADSEVQIRVPFSIFFSQLIRGSRAKVYQWLHGCADCSPNSARAKGNKLSLFLVVRPLSTLLAIGPILDPSCIYVSKLQVRAPGFPHRPIPVHMGQIEQD